MSVKYSVSSTVAIIGAMTHRSAGPPGFCLVASCASASAVSCSRRMSSLARSARMPRSPRAGFSSCASLRKASGLSAPASRTRTTTFLPGNAESSSVYDSRCCSMVGALDELRNRNSVRNSPTPSAPSATASAAPSGLPRFASSGTGRAVRQRSVGDGRGRRRGAVGCAVLRAVELVAGRTRRDDAGGGIHDHDLAVGEILRARDPDDRDDRLLAREDRGVRRRPALGGDEREHLVEVEQCRVGGGEILRDEHERVPGVGDAGCRYAAKSRDDPLGDVVEVRGALAEVPAERGQLVAERRERVEDRPLAGAALAEPGGDLVGETRILGHHRLSLEHVLRVARRPARRAARARAPRRCDGLADASASPRRR